ncbi:substrate-binding domain-containing protein [Sinanaerobacter chloroacetimidivorans]|uniref:Substrate-binding domain-containing protein n=1 Tax=Sinanaerobacter chloroacetimidivorans TaxID=2818044 RepID=A0A8J7VZW5_9FIRM|nr:substrate-binding domain-containing protein [Sinanaerobacter chloroacetimidivorans]MBR0598217.1 substrate-binding domain-containing protein [Sinanaerobacter chloroacetimidivorans]
MKKNHIILLSVSILAILIITLLIYYNINNALHSIDKSDDIVVSNTNPDYHFAMICENMEDPFWLSIKKGVETASKEFNVAVEFNWPSGANADEQWKSLDMAIVSKVDGIVTYVWDEEETGQLINQSVEKGIPMVTIRTDAKNSKRAAFVGLNTYSAGTEMGRMLLAATGDQGDAVILVSNHETGGTVVQNLMISGIKDAVQSSQRFNLNTIEYDQANFISLEDTIKDVLVNQPGLDAIICTNEKDTALVAQRLIDLNKVNYNIIGYGDSPEILRYIDNGVIFGTVTANHEQMGYDAIKALVDLKTKGRTSAYFTADTHLITKTNVAKYLNSSEE